MGHAGCAGRMAGQHDARHEHEEDECRHRQQLLRQMKVLVIKRTWVYTTTPYYSGRERPESRMICGRKMLKAEIVAQPSGP